MVNPSTSSESQGAGEKLIYQPPRNWSSVMGAIFGLFFAVLLGAVWLVLSIWKFNIINLSHEIPGFAPYQNASQVQGIEIIRLGSLILGGLILISSLITLAMAIFTWATVTDHRIMGRTGRYLFRRFDIPFEKVAWINFPRGLFGKGSLTIYTKDGKTTTLWNLAKPEVFLGYIESQYTAETRPLVKRHSFAGLQTVGLILALVVIAVPVYLFYDYFVKEKAQAPAAMVIADEAVATSSQEVKLGVLPTTRPTATIRPQPIEVDFSSLGSYSIGTEVIMVGRLTAIRNTFCDTETCGLALENIENSAEYIMIRVDIPPEEATPAPNEMKSLFEGFNQSDIRVRTADGSYALVNYRIRVQGRICETTDGNPCITDITKIDLVQVK
jgi:Bacterial PH domain